MNNGQLQQGLNEYEWRWDGKDNLSGDEISPASLGWQRISQGENYPCLGRAGPPRYDNLVDGLEYLDKRQTLYLNAPKIGALICWSLPNVTVKVENRLLSPTDKILIIIFLWVAFLNVFTLRFQRENL